MRRSLLLYCVGGFGCGDDVDCGVVVVDCDDVDDDDDNDDVVVACSLVPSDCPLP